MIQIFDVIGKVVPKGRPRFWEGKVITPQATKDYEQHILKTWISKFKVDKFPDDTPLAITVVAYYQTPKSREEESITHKGKFCKSKPDVDNIVKIFMDALNKWAYSDDSRIVCCHCIKKYGPEEKATVYLTTLENEEDFKKYSRFNFDKLMEVDNNET